VRTLKIRNRRQIIAQSNLLILALEEAIGYEPHRRLNRPQPELYRELNLGDPDARSEICELIDELRKLNAFLESTRSPRVDSKPIVDAKKHLNTLLGKAATAVGYGAGVLAVAVAANILQGLGVDFSVLAPVLNRGRH
jgi:hypothetical protein